MAHRKGISWEYSGSLFSLAYARVMASISVASKEITFENLNTATIAVEGEFVAEPGTARSLAKDIIEKIFRFLRNQAQEALDRVDVAKRNLEMARAALRTAEQSIDTASRAMDSLLDGASGVEAKINEAKQKLYELANPGALASSALAAARRKMDSVCPTGSCSDICLFCVPKVGRRRRFWGSVWSAIEDTAERAGDAFEDLADDVVDELKDLSLDDIWERLDDVTAAARNTISGVAKQFLPACDCKLYGPDPVCNIGNEVCKAARGSVFEAMSQLEGTIAYSLQQTKVWTDKLYDLQRQVSFTQVARAAKRKSTPNKKEERKRRNEERRKRKKGGRKEGRKEREIIKNM